MLVVGSVCEDILTCNLSINILPSIQHVSVYDFYTPLQAGED